MFAQNHEPDKKNDANTACAKQSINQPLRDNSASLASNTVVIGAFRSTCKDRNSFAYVFVRAADGTWRQQTKLTAGARNNKE
ncbi:MAG: hypothetical protein GY820_00535 [Gammaproteobacteria bacterium]|nr:hypothetical protein [Gammaproteobacteria bacterium]